jgi:hypothetical protein
MMEEITMKQVVLEHSEILFHENGIVELRFQNDVDIELTEVQKQEDIILSQLDDSQEIFMLVIPGDNSTLEKGVKEFSKKHSIVKKRTVAQAVVVSSLAQRLLLNFFLKYSKRNMVLFNSRRLATDWLLKRMESKRA